MAKDAKTIVRMCDDEDIINKITDIITKNKNIPLNQRHWTKRQMYIDIFNVLADNKFLKSEYGFSMYVLAHLEEVEAVPRVMIFKELATEDKRTIVIAFNANLKLRPDD